MLLAALWFDFYLQSYENVFLRFNQSMVDSRTHPCRHARLHTHAHTHARTLNDEEGEREWESRRRWVKSGRWTGRRERELNATHCWGKRFDQNSVKETRTQGDYGVQNSHKSFQIGLIHLSVNFGLEIGIMHFSDLCFFSFHVLFTFHFRSQYCNSHVHQYVNIINYYFVWICCCFATVFVVSSSLIPAQMAREIFSAWERVWVDVVVVVVASLLLLLLFSLFAVCCGCCCFCFLLFMLLVIKFDFTIKTNN